MQYLLTSSQDGEAWWDNLDFSNDTLSALLPDLPFDPSPTQSYVQLMQQYFDRRSTRAQCPSPNKTESMWYSAPACLADHDLEIVNVFLNLFFRNVPRSFRMFQKLPITSQARPYSVLAAAAVGGLYCTTPGSFEFSKAMYNDSRRLLFASVCELISSQLAPTDIGDQIRPMVHEMPARLRGSHGNSQHGTRVSIQCMSA